MNVALSQQAWGAILVSVSFASYLKGWFRTLSAVAVFFGIILIGLNGWIITHIAKFIALIAGLLGPWVAGLLGVGVSAVGAAVVAWLIFTTAGEWMPKNSAKKGTYWKSALLAVIVLVFFTGVASTIQGLGSGV